jgi:hypothetical protein
MQTSLYVLVPSHALLHISDILHDCADTMELFYNAEKIAGAPLCMVGPLRALRELLVQQSLRLLDCVEDPLNKFSVLPGGEE